MRILALLFAGLCYAIFFATFLYLIGFTGDFAVPQTVNSPAGAEGAAAFAIDLGLIALFGVQHSVMARQGFKAAWTQVVPKPVERSVYVLLSSATLILLFEFWQPLPATIWRVEGVAATILWTLFAAGWGIVLLSTFLINHFELFGLQQVWHNWRGQTAAAPQFRTPFFYRLVRHPLYSGFFLAFWATPHMTAGHLLLAVGMSAYMLIAIGYEERDLIGLFGSEYEDYRARTGKLFPRLGGRG